MSDHIPYLSYLLSAFIGIGLAAATGFRVFLPMFAVSLASYLHWIPMNESFEWLAGRLHLLRLVLPPSLRF
nr:DUF4126 domain-containing protein [uncultured Chryseobacterium sp.]